MQAKPVGWWMLGALIWLATAASPARAAEGDWVDLISSRPPCDQTCNTRHAVIFVHGFWGSDVTWRNEAGATSWPLLVRNDPFFKDFDVYRVNYYSRPWGANQPRFSDLSAAIFKKLRSHNIYEYATLHFIGHSMGGLLVIRQLMEVKTHMFPVPHAILDRYRSLILLGTPTEGTVDAVFGRLFNPTQLQALVPLESNEFLYSVRRDFEAIKEKHLAGCLTNLTVSAGFETEAYLGRVVVPRASAVSLAPDRQKGFARNHFTLVKPATTSDPVYDWVRAQIDDGVKRPKSTARPCDG